MMSAIQSLPLSLAQDSSQSEIDLALSDRRLHAFVEIFPNPVVSGRKGQLSGLSFAAKDMFAFKGRAPLCGLATAPDLGLSGTAPLLEILLDAGARFCGFTTLTALAYEPSGVNADGSRPLNPWDEKLITGGSSSGSAVAVAAGLVDFAIGSDTAGSLRIPAQACGVASYKPSYGLLSVEGAMPLAPSLDCLGFLARDVGLLQKIAEEFVVSSQPTSLRFYLAPDLDDLCVPDISEMMQNLRMTMKTQSIEVSSLSLAKQIHAADAPLFALLEGEAAQSFSSLISKNALPEKLAHRLSKGLRHDNYALKSARAVAATLHAQWLKQVPPDGCVILPAMPCLTPEIDLCTQGSSQFSAKALYALSEFARLGSLLGLPVVTVPSGLDHRGAPLAVQIMGHRGQDHAVLAAALKIQMLCHFENTRTSMIGRNK